MAVNAYLRFSTDHQDERQQLNTITKYAEAKGMRIDKIYSDEGISGGTSYTKRNLFDLCNDISEGDVIIISEISRLTRSGIGELSEIIEKYFKPNRLRLIICNVGLDIDCTDINPMVEMQLMMLATFAKIEKQLIQDRTKSALEVRKKQIKEQGYFINKKGEKVTSFAEAWGKNTGTTREQACEKARKAMSKNRREKAMSHPANRAFYDYVCLYEQRNGKIKSDTNIDTLVDELNRLRYKTATGLEFNSNRCRAMLTKTKLMYAKI